MRAAVLASLFAAAAFAQDSSAEGSSAAAAPSQTGDAFPQTTFLSQTDSRGVVTGQPAPATNIPNQPAAGTSQPALETSVGNAASIPAVGTGIQTILVPGTAGPNSTQTLVVSANNSTTVIMSATSAASSGQQSGSGSATGTGSEATGTGSEASGSGTATGTGAESTGAAATMRAVAGSVVGVGAFMAAFL